RHLARAKLAKRQNDRSAPRHAPMLAREDALDMNEASLDDARRQGRIGERRHGRFDRRGPQPQADGKEFLLGEIAQRIEEFLGLEFKLQDLSGALPKTIFIEGSLDDFRIDRGVEYMRTAHDGAREPWRAAKNFAEQFADRRIGFQHRKK